jgi:hypothetical protein
VRTTEHTANPASTPKTGLFATLRALLHAQGSGAPSRALPLSFALSIAALLALTAGVARAEAPRLVPNGTFASEGGLGVAVDQSSHDVFVTAFLNYAGGTEARSEKFDAAETLLSPPSPFAEGVNYGAAVNPTNGDLYVASTFSSEIDTYDPNTGALLSSFPVPPFWVGINFYEEVFGNLAQIATDSAGNVYVSNVPENEVLEYSPTPTVEEGVAVPLKTFTGSGVHALRGPTGVAVDSSGNVWVADDGNNRVEEFSPTGAFLSEFKSEGVQSLALDSHGDILAIVDNSAHYCGSYESPCAHLVEYSSSGVQLADLGAGDFGAVGLNFGRPLSMVAVDESSGRVYVTDGGKNLVWVFQPPVAPVLGRESAAEVGTVEAKLGAVVDPGGAQTTYRFEYDTREYTEGEAPHGVSVPFPEGSAGEGFSSRTVWASAGGLAPGTTYHYRAVVTNGVGKPVVGPDETFTTETAAQAACPNEQARGGFSAALPDCRAYEAVVPPNKASAQPRGGGAANDGNRMSYVSDEVMPGSQSGGLEFVATRGASGWSSEDVIPLQSYSGDRCPWFGQSNVLAYSADLSKAVLFVDGDGGFNGPPGRCRGEIVEVVPGEPLGVQNMLLRDNTDGAYQLIDVTPPGVTPANASFIAASADLSRVLFEESAKLTPDALENAENVYEWSKDVVRLAFVLPSGAPVAGSFAGISADGSDAFFTAGGDLYVRLNGERTVQVDEAQGGSGPGGGGSFGAVTADGSQVFFTDANGLTAGSTAETGKPDLYRYEFDAPEGERLTDLTVDGSEAANVQDVLGVSEDGSHVYFTTKGVLPGSVANEHGETAQSGQPNVYLWDGGATTFITHANEHTRVSPNGAYLAFGGGLELYSAAANRFECASCNPFGDAGNVESSSSVSNNGQVFFQTSEALLPRDTNGVADVYEYDFARGLHLISTGTSSSGSGLLGSSASGNDVFFIGRQALLPGEPNGESNAIYDARVDGGFPVTAVPVCTTADACRSASAPQPSIFGEPASQTLSGAGNLVPPPPAKVTKKTVKCKRGFVKKKVKKKEQCVKVKSKKRAKRASRNRRGK